MVRKTLLLITVGLMGLGTTLVHSQEQAAPGAVYVMTNAEDGNAILVYKRATDGALTLAGSHPTGGLGTGVGLTVQEDPLGSQNSLLLSDDKRWLLAVNAGSDEISVFRVRKARLALTDTVPSGGDYPVSLTLRGDLLYVLNSGGDGNITGFTLDQRGTLTPLPGSTRSLNAATPPNPNGPQPIILESPAQVQFNPTGDVLVVTDKGVLSGQGLIHVFTVGPDGLPSAEPVTTPSQDLAPFGFTFDQQGHLLVTETINGAVSSYAIAPDGSLSLIDASVANGQLATCWIARSGPYAYATNTNSSTLSAYRVDQDGDLTLLNLDGIAAIVGQDARPIDLSASSDGRFLYVLTPGNGTIDILGIDRATGSLTALGEVTGLPVLGGTQGIVAR